MALKIKNDQLLYPLSGSFSGSFVGDGSQLTGIVSSKWSGSNPITRDGNVEITGSLKVTGGITGSLFGTSSFALTASYLDNYIPPFPFTGSARITGSLNVIGPVTTTGSLNISGSIQTTGSTNLNLLDGNTWLKSVIGLGTDAATSAFPNNAPFVRFSMRNDTDTDYGFLQSFSSVANGGMPSGFQPLKIEGRNIIFAGGSDSSGDSAYFDRTGSFGIGNYIGSWLGSNTLPPPLPAKFNVRLTSGSFNLDLIRAEVTSSLGLTTIFNVKNDGRVIISGSLDVTNGITGSLLGTASFSTQALTASFTLTASYVLPLQQDVLISGSLYVTASNDILLRSLSSSLYISGNRLGINDINPDSTLTFRTFGSSTSTDAFRIYNSSGSGLLRIVDNGRVLLGMPTSSNSSVILHVVSNDPASTTSAGIIEKTTTNDLSQGVLQIRTRKVTPIGDYAGAGINFAIVSGSTVTTQGGLYSERRNSDNNNRYTLITRNNGVLWRAVNFEANGDMEIAQQTFTNVPEARLTVNGKGSTSSTINLNLINSSNRIILQTRDNGFTGINKSSPNSELDISGSVIITGSLNVTNGITGSLFGTASYALTASFVDTTSTNAFIQGGNSFGTQALLGTNDNQNLAFETSGSVRMFISSSGFVGIGTTTPTSDLTIVRASTGTGIHVINGNTSGILVSRYSGAAGAGFTTQKFGGTFATPIAVTNSENLGRYQANAWDGTDSQVAGYLHFISAPISAGTISSSSLPAEAAILLNAGGSANNIVERIRFTYDGNVGIGTTTPNYRLQISGSGVSGSFNANNVLYVSGSNVGIGKTNPAHALDVQGSLRTNGNGLNTYYFLNSDADNREAQILLGNTAGRASIGLRANSNNLFIKSSNGGTPDSIVVDYNNGNVGIGNISPTALLHISGSSSNALFEIDSPTLNNILFVSGSGNVGIGTNITSASLHIKGTANTSSFVLFTETTDGLGRFRIYNTNVGTLTGISNPSITVGDYNESFGVGALRSASFSNAGLTRNVAIGPFAMSVASNMRGNVAIGLNAMSTVNPVGSISGSIAIGDSALGRSLGGSFNIAIGQNAMLGTSAAVANLGERNLAIGAEALRRNTSGSRNNALGDSALNANDVGSFNTANGNRSLQFNTSGSYNSGLGYDSLNSNTSGSFNTALGSQALRDNTTGDRNIGIGWDSGRGITTGRANTIIGGVTGLASNLSNTIILADGDGNQRFTINSSSIATLSGSLTATLGFTGSLFGTASFANTASYVNPLRQEIIVSGAIDLSPSEDPNLAGDNLKDTYLFVSSSNTDLGYDLYVRQNGNLVKWKWIEGSLESGLLFGGVVTYSGSLVYVTSGSGIIVDHNAVTGSEISPMVSYVTWNAITQSITNIASQQVTYLYIDDTGALQQQSTRFTNQQYHNYIPLGAVAHFDYNQISAFGGQVQTSYDQISQLTGFVDAFGPLKLSGYGLTGQSGSLRLSVSSGTSFIHGGFYADDPQFPSQFTTPAVATASFAYVHRSGSGVYFDTNGGNLYTSLRPQWYDNGTGITGSVSNNNWTIQRVYSDPKTGILYIYYGQTIYANFLTALADLSVDPFTEGDTFDFTTFVGFLVLKSNTSDITNIDDNRIVSAGLFRGSGQGSGGGAVVSNLDDLTDVSITGPANGQALIYDSGIWQNGIPSNATSASFASFATTSSFPWNISGSTISYLNGNVGIGTQSPTALLHISGANTANSASFLVQNSAGQTLISALNNRTVNINATNAVNGDTNIGTTNGIIYFNAGYNNQFRGNSLSFYSGGDASTIQGFTSAAPGIAIGYAWTVTNPNTGSALSIRGTVSTSGSGVLFVTGSSNTTLLRLSSEVSSSILVVSGSGRVGIGTSNPASLLHVSSDSSLLQEIRLSSAGGDSATIQNHNGRAYLGTTSNTQTVTLFGGLVGINQQTPTARLHIVGTGATSATTTFLIQNSTPSNILLVRDDGRIAFGSSGAGNAPLLFNSSDEGSSIGLSARKLAFVSQDGNPGSNFSFTLNNPTGITTGTLNNIVSRASITLSSGDTILNQYLINPALALSSTYSGTVRGIFYNPTISSIAGTHRAIETTSGDVLFQSGSSTLLLVSGSGRVGIGTGAPLYSLDVNGTIRSQGQLIVVGQIQNPTIGVVDVNGVLYSGTGVSIGVNSTNVARLLVRGTGTTNSTTALRVENSNTSASLVVLDNGFVGVGTATPSSSLHIVSSSATLKIQQSTVGSVFNGLELVDYNGGINASYKLNQSSGEVRLFAGATIFPTFYSNNAEIMRISTAGNVGIGTTSPTARLNVAGTTRLSSSFNTAISGSTLTVIGSGSAQPIFTVQGSQGELFSITDSLSGSLFSVNDISGLPIMEVFSDNTILMGDYQDPMLLTTKKITQTNSGSFVVYSIPTASYDGAFIDFTIKSGSNARAGTIMSTWVGSSIEFTEVDTMDIGSTAAVGLTMILSGSNAVMTGSSSTGAWTIRTIIRTI